MTLRTSILMICALVALLTAWMGPSVAAEPEMWLWGPGDNPADINREVLWLDNPDFAGRVASSEVIGEYGLTSEIANDFALDTDATVRKVFWWGTYWNEFDGIPTGAGFNIRFYMPDADCLPEIEWFLEYLLPGNDCCEAYAEGGDQYSQFVYEFYLELPLPAGLYWLSVQMADHEFPPQWGRQGADITQSCESAWKVTFGYPEWVPCGDVFGDDYDASQMFEDECEATTVENASWGAVKGLYR